MDFLWIMNLYKGSPVIPSFSSTYGQKHSEEERVYFIFTACSPSWREVRAWTHLGTWRQGLDRDHGGETLLTGLLTPQPLLICVLMQLWTVCPGLTTPKGAEPFRGNQSLITKLFRGPTVFSIVIASSQATLACYRVNQKPNETSVWYFYATWGAKCLASTEDSPEAIASVLLIGQKDKITQISEIHFSLVSVWTGFMLHFGTKASPLCSYAY